MIRQLAMQLRIIFQNTITDSPQSEKEASLAAQLQDVVRQSAATISTHIQEISSCVHE